ncbi:MAG TPA: outer membrane beta-barrel protein [Bacteroidales bacterium]|jgi:opacity protein-like surface antigen|nr:outer membrane beta-barrel protein [Bacteroidales bacterium]HQJ82565.1 outer membrane beta-barrel protein [Bacteroidales bacterium]
MNKTITHMLVLILNTLISFPIYSQTDKGRVIISGNYNLDFSSTTKTFKSSVNSYEMEKDKSFEFSPFLGYTVIKNLSPGIQFDYEYSKSQSPNGLGDNDINSSSSILIIPSIRYYLLNSIFKPYLQVGYGFGWQKLVESYFQTSNLKHNNTLSKWEISGGLSYFINNNISLDLLFGYHSMTVFYKDEMVNGSYNKWQNVINGPKAFVGITLFL